MQVDVQVTGGTTTARLVDEGRIRTTLTTQLGPIDAANLRRAHELVESSATIGKVVVAGFDR
ncbi:zinc-binding dehydrogenase [Micromonospora sp. NBC_01796]|uniref:zinc-binding dehydrogenase n=1 Tax=Micromonospora sp. NBC_01796 TaxID=2975987 RepID=UPI002DDAEA75|nr:zinc-binding dehydrogenase [Micromonospora sp. NBC_01796]WSA83708.1 zinc-binding dehydrogenase [Micromonospora sp. NBC_01796]